MFFVLLDGIRQVALVLLSSLVARKKIPITLGAVAQFAQFAMAFHAQLPPLPSQLAAHDERQVPPFFGSADRSISAVGTQSVA
jgi:hypothetical protein